MTTQVRMSLNHNPHNAKVEVVALDASGETVLATLTEVGQEYVATIFDTRQVTVREVKLEG